MRPRSVMKSFQIPLMLGAILVVASTSTLADSTHSGSGLVDADLRAVGQLTDRDGVAWLRKAAEQGQADAQNKLGWMYVRGRGVPQDYKEALVWLRKAAEQGNSDAQFGLGVMYDNGLGVPQDDKEAVVWYRKAAEQGHAIAQNNLGRMCAEGRGLPQDDKEALA